MKKIGLVLATEPEGGGMFQYNLALLEAVDALPRERFFPVVVYMSELWKIHLGNRALRTVFTPKQPWWRVLGSAWRAVGLPMKAWRVLVSRIHPVATSLLKGDCDLWIFPSQDSLSYQMPVTALTAIHDLMHRYERRFPEVGNYLEYHVRERHYRNICRQSKGILVDSEMGKQHVIESYNADPKRIHVLPYVAPAYMWAGDQRPSLTREYELPAKFIFYPAQFWQHKNHINLIKAIAALKSTMPEIRLVLVGSINNGYMCAVRLVRDLGLSDHVRFLGYVPDEDMPQLYRLARAMVMPTYFGPTNIPPLEAFVAGCPVAISAVYGIPRQVGDAALLFNPDSVEEIARAIAVLWTDDHVCAELERKGREMAKRWDQAAFNAEFARIVESVLDD